MDYFSEIIKSIKDKQKRSETHNNFKDIIRPNEIKLMKIN